MAMRLMFLKSGAVPRWAQAFQVRGASSNTARMDLLIASMVIELKSDVDSARAATRAPPIRRRPRGPMASANWVLVSRSALSQPSERRYSRYISTNGSSDSWAAISWTLPGPGRAVSCARLARRASSFPSRSSVISGIVRSTIACGMAAARAVTRLSSPTRTAP